MNGDDPGAVPLLAGLAVAGILAIGAAIGASRRASRRAP
jgi:hypothetical protein